jgi:hypothetical protein
MKKLLLSTVAALMLGLTMITTWANAQDYEMRRTNSVGNWTMNLENEGHFFNADDSVLRPVFPGSYWRNPRGGSDTLIFGGGIWVAARRRVNGSLLPAVSYGYEPNGAGNIFVPGSSINDGAFGDTTQVAREKYKLYRSTDQTLPLWPVRLTPTGPHYIDDVNARQSAGPAYVIGDEDMFAVYKDSDPRAHTDPSNHLQVGLEVRSTMSFWRKGHGADVVVVHNEIIHTAADTLFDPVVGLALDGDIGNPKDDRLKGVQNEAVHGAVFFTEASMSDPFLGVVLLSGQHNHHREDAGLTTLKYWNMTEDPKSDSARFAFMTSGARDTGTSQVGDARLLMASASHEILRGFDTLYFDYAIFAVAPSGKFALDPSDSARVLHFAEEITNDYTSGKLSQLNVPKTVFASGLDVYPNPACDVATVSFSSNKSEVVRLFDVMGREVRSYQFVGGRGSLDLRGLASGRYFLWTSNASAPTMIEHLR